jgi:hypothetical protein
MKPENDGRNTTYTMLEICSYILVGDHKTNSCPIKSRGFQILRLFVLHMTLQFHSTSTATCVHRQKYNQFP